MLNTTNQVYRNAAWIIGCKIVQSVLTLVITMLSARYLGPSNYGLINYAASIVTFLVPVMQLGFRSTLVQELIESPRQEGEILGTAITLNIVAGFACVVGIASFVRIVNRSETQTMAVCVLYSVSLLFQATEMIQYWFQAKLLSQYTSVTMLLSYIVVSAYKIGLLITGKSVRWFAAAYSIDFFLISAILLVIYRRKGGIRLSFSRKLGKQMLNKSKYYILSGLMVNIFQQTDRIMLKLMLGNESTGLYSAAVACAGLASFVYNAVIDSARPVIFRRQQESQESFCRSVSVLYGTVFYLSAAQCLVMVPLSPWIVQIIYGSAYIDAAGILRIGVWMIVFSYMGTVRNIWILAQRYQALLLPINLSGAVVNVLLNLLLIPRMGGHGAALASLATQFFSNFILGFLIRPLRSNNVLLLRGLNPRIIPELFKKIREKV